MGGITGCSDMRVAFNRVFYARIQTNKNIFRNSEILLYTLNNLDTEHSEIQRTINIRKQQTQYY